MLRTRKVHRHLAGLALIAGLGAAGCKGTQPLEPRFDQDLGEFVVQKVGPEHLVHTLRLSHAEVAPGDTLRVVSTVMNDGDAPAAVTARICGLDVRTDLVLRDPWTRCGAYSSEFRLAPGDSAWAADGGIVASGPGRYTLRVRHLLDPQHWVEVRIWVRD